jgi:hypothetical protein
VYVNNKAGHFEMKETYCIWYTKPEILIPNDKILQLVQDSRILFSRSRRHIFRLISLELPIFRMMSTEHLRTHKSHTTPDNKCTFGP